MPAPHRAPARALSVLAALGLGLGLVAVPTPALAGERTDLPVTGAVDLVLDEGRGRLLIAQGRGSAELLVTDLAGTPTGRVPVADAVDPQRLVVAPDGSALVGTRGHRWDPLTLELLAAYDLPTNRYDEPFEGLDVVFAPDGRAVFTSYGVAPVEPVWTVPAGSLESRRTYDLRQELDSGLGINAWRSPEAVAVGAVDTYVVSQARDGYRLDVLSPGPDATLTLAEPATAYPYGARVKLPVQLDARSAERSLRVWTYGVNGGVVEGPAVTLAADGSGRVPLRLKKSTTVLVGYDAVDTSESVVTRARLMVSPRLVLGFPGARAGRVPAYAAGRAARIEVAVKGRPECVRILVERRTSAGWRPLSRSGCDTPRGGEVSAVLPWRADLRGAALRASVESRKDRFWAASAAGPERFTFR